MFIMMKPFSDQDEVTLVSWKGTMIPPNNPKGAMQGWRGRGQDSGASHFWWQRGRGRGPHFLMWGPQGPGSGSADFGMDPNPQAAPEQYWILSLFLSKMVEIWKVQNFKPLFFSSTSYFSLVPPHISNIFDYCISHLPWPSNFISVNELWVLENYWTWGPGFEGQGPGSTSFWWQRGRGRGPQYCSGDPWRPGSGVAVSYLLPLGAGSGGPIFIFVPAPPPLEQWFRFVTLILFTGCWNTYRSLDSWVNTPVLLKA
jgi:hypothetical protein